MANNLSDKIEELHNEQQRYTKIAGIVKIISIFLGITVLVSGLSTKPDANNQLVMLGIFRFENNSESRMIISLLGLLLAYFGDRAGELFQNLSSNSTRSKEIRSFHQDQTKRFENVKTEFDDLRRYTSKIFNSEPVKGAAKVQEYVSSMASEAIKVRNTFVQMNESQDIGDIVSVYNDFLKNPDKEWFDIVTIAELHSNRYKLISPNKGYVSAKSVGAENLTPQVPGNIAADRSASEATTQLSPASEQPQALPRAIGSHQIALLRHGLPMVNFIIFDYPPGRQREALFGWGKGGQYGEELVFRTVDVELIRLLENLFGALFDKRQALIKMDYSKEGKERIFADADIKAIDKEGYWFTKSFRRDDNGEMKFVRMALFRISFISGTPVITGLVSDPSLSADDNGDYHLEHINHKGRENVDHSLSKIYVEYNLSGAAEFRNGFVMYKFELVSGIEAISGFFVDSVSGMRTELIGCKVHKTELKISPVSKRSLLNAKHNYEKSVDELFKAQYVV